MLKYVVPLAAFALLGVFLGLGLNRDPTFVPSPLIGKPAPAFTLPSLQNPDDIVDSAELRGRPYVLNVWATWCLPCRQEHEVLVEIARRRQVPIVGLNWKDDAATARQWLVELGNPYAVVAQDSEGRVAIDWGVYGAPETFLVDANGVVQYKHITPMTLEIWNREFVPRLAAAGAAP
jgi:cytochrome c biogenesis protein CcmG/thiol:disulfide interchange protein DsbE